jgi:hypothetical protein
LTPPDQQSASPVASSAVPAAPPPDGGATDASGRSEDGAPGGGAGADEARAAEALRAAFARLAPQGSDAWNFLAAFTHLGDRYGPYHPGASELSDALEAQGRAGRPPGRRRGRRRGGERPADGAPSELEEAMGHVVEAFRFLSARVASLEARLADEDRPVEGAAWLAPARELGPWAGPVAAHVLARSPGGDFVHADCGEGGLLDALAGRGAVAHGVEPRGAVALHALERGYSVTIAEASEYLAGRPSGSVGAVVLSGVVDRLPLHALVPLLQECRRTLARSAPLVIVSEPAAAAASWEAPARDLTQGRPLHEATWELLLDRAGFIEVAPLPDGTGGDDRFALSAATPS